jgi:hypothetical protein
MIKTIIICMMIIGMIGGVIQLVLGFTREWKEYIETKKQKISKMSDILTKEDIKNI